LDYAKWLKITAVSPSNNSCNPPSPSPIPALPSNPSKQLLPVLLTVGKRGTKVEWYVSANGDVPSTAEMTAANLAAEYHAELYHGMQASQ
jgi:hypothetical protein